MKKLGLILLLVVPFGCKPADEPVPPADSNSTSATATQSSDELVVDDNHNTTHLVVAS